MNRGTVKRLNGLVLVSLGALAVSVVAAAVITAGMPRGLWLGALLLLPLLPPLSGLVQGRRRTFAWATLCLTPYFVYGLTESIANPDIRVPAAIILFASLASFVALVAYLRATRPSAPAAAE